MIFITMKSNVWLDNGEVGTLHYEIGCQEDIVVDSAEVWAALPTKQDLNILNSQTDLGSKVIGLCLHVQEHLPGGMLIMRISYELNSFRVEFQPEVPDGTTTETPDYAESA